MSGPVPRALMYHYVRDGSAVPVVGYRAMEPAAFEQQLDEVCRAATPVGWAAIAEALSGGRPLPPDAVVLTFDDGLVDHHRVVLPILARRDLPAIFFVLSRRPEDGLALGHRLHLLLGRLSPREVRAMIVERLAPADRALPERLEARLRGRPLSDPDDVWKRPLQRELEAVAAPILGALVSELIGAEGDIAAQLYLSDDQLADLRKAEMDLGGHGFDHPWLDFVGRSRVVAELEASARLLSRFCDEPWPFAYPYGGVPGDVASLLPPAGFGAAFTTNPVDQDPPLHIGRLDADELSTGPAHALAAPP